MRTCVMGVCVGGACMQAFERVSDVTAWAQALLARWAPAKARPLLK